MPTRAQAGDGTGTDVGPPLGMVVLLLFAAVWLCARIIGNVTAALTAMTGGHHAAPAPPAWPARLL